MFTRLTGFFIVPIWMAAMGWLIRHDVWPRWAANEPPVLRSSFWTKGTATKEQYTIEGSFGPIGSIWTNYLIDEGSIRRDDVVWIENLPLDLVPLRIEVTSVFTAEGLLDEFTVRLENRHTPNPIKLHGERFHADFSFTLEAGPAFSAFKIPLSEASLITGAFSPFARFSELRVGQSWRMQVYNPLAAITNLGGKFIPLLVSVSGEERIRTPEWEGNCLMIEAGHVRAWVDAEGQVQRQEIQLPVFGQVSMYRKQSVDLEARNAARKVQFTRRR